MPETGKSYKTGFNLENTVSQKDPVHLVLANQKTIMVISILETQRLFTKATSTLMLYYKLSYITLYKYVLLPTLNVLFQFVGTIEYILSKCV